MYTLSRLLLILGASAGLYCLVLLIIVGWPGTGLALGCLLLAHTARRGYQRLTTLGSARWASERDLQQAEMLDAGSGLILGRLPIRRKPNLFVAIAKLFHWRLAAAQGCEKFWAAFRKPKPPLVRLPRAIHTAVFSPSGGGKGVSCVIPFLMTCQDSCVVVDFKGENAKLTAEHRRRNFGHQIVLLDPFKVVTRSPDTFNPLDSIDRDSSLALDECNDLAKALVIRPDEEKEPHWNDSAESWIAALLATVVQYGQAHEGTRSLQTIRDILSDPQKLEMSLKLMGESTAWGGLLARMGGQLKHFVEKERSSTLTTVARHMRFLDSMAITESTMTSSFDPSRLRGGKMTIYLILPPDHMRAQSALLRMWIGSMLKSVIRGGLQESTKVHFILDEAASLGHLEAVDDAVDKYRGYGVRLQFYFQSLGQLKKCFPAGQEQTLLSNTSQIFFGVNDNITADYVSARLGEETIIVDSGGRSSGTSDQHTNGAQPTRSLGSSDNSSSNWQQQARKLLKPEEVIALSPRDAITFMPGVRPIYTTLLRYFEEKHLGQIPSRFAQFRAACWMLTISTMFCAEFLAVATAMTLVISRETQENQSATAMPLEYQPPMKFDRQ